MSFKSMKLPVLKSHFLMSRILLMREAICLLKAEKILETVDFSKVPDVLKYVFNKAIDYISNKVDNLITMRFILEQQLIFKKGLLK